ncbi:TlpA disulfide reductase family protein [Chitinophaga sp. S165]|uniref:TlpA disulfide reductase family protein n=1 Tax=Chitinophaga sp. S165 TaxID=2135462 RepID=UPI000D709CD7|nr:TlpA disulfide reductase family protein [Chitinophaga sp. S165]PWV45401.1 peroxiredoxin [Chitinophaga sp. S165]
MKLCNFFITMTFACLYMLQPVTAQTDKKEFVIDGTIRNFAVMPPKVYLYMEKKVGENGRELSLSDSTTVKNGKFRFSGNVTGLTEMQLAGVVPQTDGRGMVFIDRADVHVTGGTIHVLLNKKFKHNIVSGDGAKAELDYREAIKKAMPFIDSLRTIATSEEAKTNPTVQMVVSQMMGEAMTLMNECFTNFVKTHPSSQIAPKLMVMLISSNSSASADDSLLNILPPGARTYVLSNASVTLEKKRAAQLKKAQAEALTSTGTTASDFTEKDVNGRPVSLSSYRGKYVLVDFWASWCGPCRAENPNVLSAYQRFKDKGFDILGVSLDAASQEDAWKRAIEKDGLPWVQVSELNGFESESARLYGVTSIPQNFLIDPNGVIIAKNLRGEALHQKLAEVLK